MNIESLLNQAGLFYKSCVFKLTKRKLLIIAGDKNCLLIAQDGAKQIERVEIGDNNFERIYQFVNRYPTYTIYLLWDNTINIVHEEVPVLQSLRRENPVVEYLHSKYDHPRYCISYDVHSVTGKEPEIWDLELFIGDLSERWQQFINTVIKDGQKFGGVYIMPQILPKILHAISRAQGIIPSPCNVQIFVVFSYISGLRAVVTDERKVILAKDLPYPSDASLEYIRGVIEQELSDITIFLNNYLGKGNQEVKNVTLLLPEELATRCSKSNFGFTNQYVLSSPKLSLTDNEKAKAGYDVDLMLAQYFYAAAQYQSYNISLAKLSKIRHTSSLILWPTWITMFILGVVEWGIIYETKSLNKQVQQANIEFNIKSEEFRALKVKFPTINHLNRLADFYTALHDEGRLHETPAVLFDSAKVIFSNPKLYVDYLLWQDESQAGDYRGSTSLTLIVRYISEVGDISSAVKEYNDMIEVVKSGLSVSSISLDDKVDVARSTAFGGKAIIYAKLQLKHNIIMVKN